MAVGYFMRGAGASWAVVRIFGRDGEEVVAGDLSHAEAEALCETKMAEIPRRITEPAPELPLDDEPRPKSRAGRQLTLKF
jgi:hypothetical protein